MGAGLGPSELTAPITRHQERVMSMSSPPSNSEGLQAGAQLIRKHWALFLVEGIALIALGFLAIGVPLAAGLAVEIILGWILLIGGFVGLAAAIAARRLPAFGWTLLSAGLSILAGAALLWSPAQGVLSLTIVLIAFFALDGVTMIMMALGQRAHMPQGWGWLLANGVIDLFLAGVIFWGLPASAAWALGTLVGIDLLFAGSALSAISMGARQQA